MTDYTGSADLPDFDHLPVRAGAPPRAAWGLWGDDDEFGTLNLLTPERIVQAARLVRTGRTYGLNWDLELPSPPLWGREELRHTIKRKETYGRDDFYDNFNTQSSSQWDGLTHVGSATYGGFYNGVPVEAAQGGPGTRNGIQVWARRGIAGRGVLIDYRRWAEGQGINYSPGTTHQITVTELRAAADAQGVRIEAGDILLVRSGWIAWYLSLDADAREALSANPIVTAVGLAQGEETLRYLWNNHFAAVAGDTVAFEAYPAQPGQGMHEMILAMWGLPIGEMFNLEALADDCARDGVYEFFFTSAPLNKLGGVASPPNALAIK
jgi:kynurenine formamidase